jgi:exonuclease VII small subunit
MDKVNLTESLGKLEEINEWFDNQDEVDIEEGLQKVREGISLVKASKKRLQEIENEFDEVRKELVEDEFKLEATAKTSDIVDIEDIPF